MTSCNVEKCPFFANEDYFGSCSYHSRYKPIKIISILYPNVPTDILNLIWDFYYIDPKLMITDQDLNTLMGSHRFVNKSKVDELIYRFSNTTLPYIHCDNIKKAFEYLSIDKDKRFYNQDAILIMNVLLNRNYAHTNIAFQKILVLMTIHSANLPNELFSVGKCYYIGRSCKKSMSKEQILKNLIYNDSLIYKYIK